MAFKLTETDSLAWQPQVKERIRSKTSSMSGLQWWTLLWQKQSYYINISFLNQHFCRIDPWRLDRNIFFYQWRINEFEMLSYTFLYLLSHCAFSSERKEGENKKQKKNRHGMWLIRLHLVANCQFPGTNHSPKHRGAFFHLKICLWDIRGKNRNR